MSDWCTGFIDEYKSVTPSDNWTNLSIAQLIDEKNKLLGQLNGLPSDSPIAKAVQQGVDRLDILINNYGR